MTLFTSGEGNTPLTPDEQDDLIPNLATREELNQWERENILVAYSWALNPRTIARENALSEHYIRSLHQRMFDETWKWAGQYRTSEKNIGLPHHQIREQLEILIGDTSY